MANIWGSSERVRPPVRGPRRPVPESQPRARWGEGTKAGRRAAPGWKGLEASEAHLMAAPRAGGAPTGRVLPGRPSLEVQGFGVGSRFRSISPGVPPHRVRLPGENVDGADAGTEAPLPSGGV